MTQTLYLDACCLNRPFDDQSQPRIHLEAEATLLILALLAEEAWQWVGSEVLETEIDQMPDLERRRRIHLLIAAVNRSIELDSNIEQRGRDLEAVGFDAYDALQIASAEAAGVDILLTTDDQMLKVAERGSIQLGVELRNPVDWLREVL